VPTRDGLTCRGLMLCVQCSIWMLGVALWLLSVAPLPSRTRGNAALAYVVSPPPATREVMPRYLPPLPPENASRAPQVAAQGARHLRAACRCGHLRSRHARRCTHCHHRAHDLGTPRRCRHGGHCTNHRHGRSQQHRRHPSSQHGKASTGKTVFAGAIAAGFGIAVRLVRFEDGTTRWVRVNDHPSL